MWSLTLDQLPEGVLIDIFKCCPGQDLSALSRTCVAFYNALLADTVWKRLCERELRRKLVDLGGVSSYRKLYTNLLHKYIRLLGVYQTECGHYGSLLEVKYEAGTIIGTSMEGTSEPGKIFEDVVEEIQFVIGGDAEPAEPVCLPAVDPHPCIIDVDQVTGTIAYRCSSPEQHVSSLFKKLASDAQTQKLSYFSTEGTKKFRLKYLKKHMLEDRKPVVSVPLTLPSPSDLPSSLRKEDGSLPSQIITPGLFKGDYSTHGVELLLFKYVSDSELHGFKVTGDSNIPAGKISIKCFLNYPVNPTLEEQSSLESLQDLPKTERSVPIHELPKQRFKLPDNLLQDEYCTAVHAPQTCLGRYHGQCQIADHNYRDPNFIEAHVIVFNDDMIGVAAMALSDVFLFSRCKRSFALPYHSNTRSVF